MTRDVFISYAHRTSRDAAQRLHDELGAGVAFLDTSNLSEGERLPAQIVVGLLSARVVVVFADETYFERWYCLRELSIALAPYQAAIGRAEPRERTDAELAHLVVALNADVSSSVLKNLPPALQTTVWAEANDSGKLAKLVRKRLRQVRQSIRERIGEKAVAEIEAGLERDSSVPQRVC